MRRRESGERTSAPWGWRVRASRGHPLTPRRARTETPLLVGALLLAGWTLLTVMNGGIDLGDGLATRGATAALFATVIAAPTAAWALMRARNHAAVRSGPALIAIVGLLGLAVWSGISILWALAPDMAWTEANHTALAFLALMLGITLGALIPRAPERFAAGLALATAPIIAWALLARCLPTIFGSDYEPSRLQAPMGYWNALALVCVMAVPGILWWAGRRGASQTSLFVSSGALAVVITALMLTYSRSGLLGLILVLVIVLWMVPGRIRMLSVLIGGGIGALLPVVYGLTTDALTDDALIAADRSGAGFGLLWRIVLGAAIAVGIAWLAARVLGGGRLNRRRAGIAALAIAAVGVLGVVGYSAANPDTVGNWISTRASEVAGTSGGLANTPGRLGSLDTNQRIDWWTEAERSIEQAPLIGEGAGSFALVHLRERTSAEDRLNVRQPHQLVLEVLSGLGVIGLALLGCLVAGIAWAVVRARTRGAPATIALPLAIVAAFLLQCQLDWTWTVPALTTAAMAAGGVLIAAGAPGPAAPGRSLPRGAVVAGWILVPVLTISALMPWWSQQDVAAGNAAVAAGQPALADSKASEASWLNPFSIQPWLLKARAAALRGDPVALRDAARQATVVQPDNPSAWTILALALGDSAAGRNAWRHVLQLNPLDIRARAALEDTRP